MPIRTLLAAAALLATGAAGMTSQQIASAGKGPDGLLPIGPAWREVSAKCKGQRDATARLTHTVLAGLNPDAGHGTGKVSGLAMPPDGLAIQEAEAKRLLWWILSLEAGKKS